MGTFGVSIVAHLLLGILALFFVVQHYVKPPPPPRPQSDVFVTGGGGGGGVPHAASWSEVRIRRTAPPARQPARIVSRSSDATMILPDSTTAHSPTPAFASGLEAGRMPSLGKGGSGTGGGLGSGKGTGEGSGVGPGKGTGTGAGTGKGHVGKFLGTTIKATQVAVYLDKSGSMKPYLKRVETEARRIFPQAEVFQVEGISTWVIDGKIAKHPRGRLDPASSQSGKIRSDFNSVGDWFDDIIHESYDAVVIFSDFQDGVTQTEGRASVFHESRPGEMRTVRPSPERKVVGAKKRPARESGNYDYREDTQRTWENEWITRCAQANQGKAPKVYLFSTEVPPQSIWRHCAEASGGRIIMVEWLKTGGAPPPSSDEDEDLTEYSRRKRPPR